MVEGKEKASMCYALYSMRRKGNHQKRYDSKITSRVFEKVQIECSRLSSVMNSGKRISDEHKKNISLGLTGVRKGVKFSDEHRANLSKAKKGKPNNRVWSKESLEKLSKAHLGKPKSKETKQKLRRPRTEEQKEKLRKPKHKIECRHCGKIVGGESNYYRWHHDNCKSKNQSYVY
jgi:hypothetical protein